MVPERASTQRDAAKEDKPGGLRKSCQKGRWGTQRADSMIFQGQGGVGAGSTFCDLWSKGTEPCVRGSGANAG